ncbi:YciI family protein [Cupriavidus basilensis]|uniref:YciI family protein n=1 Tax=Cupriavidus basilensis TaxID=68895 RepID=UPI0039F6834F
MSYMLLIVEPVGQRAERSPEEGRQAYASMQRFAEGLNERGLLLGVNSLTSQANGVRVQVREGRRDLLDGPFVEAKEMIGGYFLLGCATQDEAIAIAAECPAAAWCTVEVREVGPCFL